MRDREVDDRRPDRDEDRPGDELRPVRDGPGDQRRGDDREHQLERREDDRRDGVALRAEGRRCRGRQAVPARGGPKVRWTRVVTEGELNPYSAHRMLMMQIVTNDIIIMFSVLLARVRPP